MLCTDEFPARRLQLPLLRWHGIRGMGFVSLLSKIRATGHSHSHSPPIKVLIVRFDSIAHIFHIRNDGMIRLNFELVRRLDHYMVRGYDDWANKAPAEWTADSFLQNNKPIVVTSRYGQDARFAVPGHEEREAQEWENRRDYSKIAFLTVAIATCIEYALLRTSPFPHSSTDSPSCPKIEPRFRLGSDTIGRDRADVPQTLLQRL